MTIQYLTRNRTRGLSSDTKPVNVPDDSLFLETDSGHKWIKKSGVWKRSDLAKTKQWFNRSHFNMASGDAGLGFAWHSRTGSTWTHSTKSLMPYDGKVTYLKVNLPVVGYNTGNFGFDVIVVKGNTTIITISYDGTETGIKSYTTPVDFLFNDELHLEITNVGTGTGNWTFYVEWEIEFGSTGD